MKTNRFNINRKCKIPVAESELVQQKVMQYNPAYYQEITSKACPWDTFVYTLQTHVIFGIFVHTRCWFEIGFISSPFTFEKNVITLPVWRKKKHRILV